MHSASEIQAMFIHQIREDWATHYRDWTAAGFRAVAVHRFGSWVRQQSGHGLVRGPLRRLLSRLHLMMFRYVRNHYGIELPVEAIIGRRVLIAHQSGIVIHFNAVIGDDCVLRQNITIGALNTDRPKEAPRLVYNASTAADWFHVQVLETERPLHDRIGGVESVTVGPRQRSFSNLVALKFDEGDSTLLEQKCEWHRSPPTC